MTTTDELTHSSERLRDLIEFALHEGWQVRRAADGRILFTKSGGAAFYTGTTTNVMPVAEENHHG